MKRMLFIALVALIPGCFPDASDIPGIYYSYHDKGFELLSINKDTTFYCISIKPDNTMIIDSGKWTYDPVSIHISFKGWPDRLLVWDCPYCAKVNDYGDLIFEGSTLARRGEGYRRYDFIKLKKRSK